MRQARPGYIYGREATPLPAEVPTWIHGFPPIFASGNLILASKLYPRGWASRCGSTLVICDEHLIRAHPRPARASAGDPAASLANWPVGLGQSDNLARCHCRVWRTGNTAGPAKQRSRANESRINPTTMLDPAGVRGACRWGSADRPIRRGATTIRGRPPGYAWLGAALAERRWRAPGMTGRARRKGTHSSGGEDVTLAHSVDVSLPPE